MWRTSACRIAARSRRFSGTVTRSGSRIDAGDMSLVVRSDVWRYTEKMVDRVPDLLNGGRLAAPESILPAFGRRGAACRGEIKKTIRRVPSGKRPTRAFIKATSGIILPICGIELEIRDLCAWVKNAVRTDGDRSAAAGR